MPQSLFTCTRTHPEAARAVLSTKAETICSMVCGLADAGGPRDRQARFRQLSFRSRSDHTDVEVARPGPRPASVHTPTAGARALFSQECAPFAVECACISSGLSTAGRARLGGQGWAGTVHTGIRRHAGRTALLRGSAPRIQGDSHEPKAGEPVSNGEAGDDFRLGLRALDRLQLLRHLLRHLLRLVLALEGRLGLGPDRRLAA